MKNLQISFFQDVLLTESLPIIVRDLLKEIFWTRLAHAVTHKYQKTRLGGFLIEYAWEDSNP